ncbi:peptide chain release factor N(5)-glutamine methyltransferase [Ligilactobacillus sp. LYQ139]|uniref:peptide chain release factor N(5)-glutamine methyltransferase n=1 Tax=Ligilactobacillus sp. LYQ139 TaxID=3378800 RepID=UPI0038552820
MISQPTYFEAQQWAFSYVAAHGGYREDATWLLRAPHEWDATALLVHLQETMPVTEWHQYQVNVQRVCTGWPPQQLVGKAPFFGRWFTVTEDTLIPRVETGDLVEWLLADYPGSAPKQVVDIGTGSGNIGITLKLAHPEWQVTLTDISPRAARVARLNARQLGAVVSVTVGDLTAPLTGQYDVLVMNPPYIAMTEQSQMDISVRKHEPVRALFAPENGLAVYRQLAKEVFRILSPHGRIYLEIGWHQGEAVRQLFEGQFPAAQVTVRQDEAGHDRMVRVCL